jgi:hypothetical protein
MKSLEAIDEASAGAKGAAAGDSRASSLEDAADPAVRCVGLDVPRVLGGGSARHFELPRPGFLRPTYGYRYALRAEKCGPSCTAQQPFVG